MVKCVLCWQIGVCRTKPWPTQQTDAIDTVAQLEPTDGAEAGERRGTPILMPMWYKSPNASLKPILAPNQPINHIYIYIYISEWHRLA